MKQVISALKKIPFRQILTVFLVGITFFVSTSLNAYAANAVKITSQPTEHETETPYYQLDPAERRPSVQGAQKIRERSATSDNYQIENPLNPPGDKSIGENVKEKLHLDQPVPESTKEFFGGVKENTGRTLTGK